MVRRGALDRAELAAGEFLGSSFAAAPESSPGSTRPHPVNRQPSVTSPAMPIIDRFGITLSLNRCHLGNDESFSLLKESADLGGRGIAVPQKQGLPGHRFTMPQPPFLLAQWAASLFYVAGRRLKRGASLFPRAAGQSVAHPRQLPRSQTLIPGVHLRGSRHESSRRILGKSQSPTRTGLGVIHRCQANRRSARICHYHQIKTIQN